MHWLDIVLLAILLFSAFQGLRRGLINTVLSIIGVIAGIILAGRFYDDVSAWFGFADNAVFNLVSFLAIIGLVMLAAAIIAKMLKLAVSVVLLGWIDHLGGAVFGLLFGGLLLGAVLSLWVILFGYGTVTESTIAAFLASKFPLVLALLPAEFDAVRQFFAGLL